MSWFDKVLDAVQTAAVIGERVERLGHSVADMALEIRDLDRRIARLEGAVAARDGGSRSSPETKRLAAPPRKRPQRS
jgi:hypothetical protein